MAELSERSGKMSSYMTFFMQVTFNTSGSVILMPWTFATLGYVSGPIFMILVFCITLQAQYWLNEAAVSISAADGKPVKSLHDLVVRMGGDQLGKVAAFLQMLNMFFVMPAELDITANALEYLVHGASGTLAHCNILYALGTAVLPILVTQFVRRFGHKTGVLAGISFVVILVKSFLIIFSISWHADAYPEAANAAPVIGMGEGPQAAGSYSWFNIITALGNFMWIFAPVFINTELVTEMQRPEDVHKQLLLAAACLVVLYTSVGVVGAGVWGTAATDPINLALPYDWAGIVTNVLLCYGAWLDYLIGSIVFAGAVQRTFEPGFDLEDFSIGACVRWFLYSLPGNLCAVLMICFVPQLETLVGVLTAFAISLMSFTVPAVAGFFWERQQVSEDGDAENPQGANQSERDITNDSAADVSVGGDEKQLVPSCWTVLQVPSFLDFRQGVVAFWGLVVMVALLSSSVYWIVTTDYTSNNYFCDVVG